MQWPYRSQDALAGKANLSQHLANAAARLNVTEASQDVRALASRVDAILAPHVLHAAAVLTIQEEHMAATMRVQHDTVVVQHLLDRVIWNRLEDALEAAAQADIAAAAAAAEEAAAALLAAEVISPPPPHAAWDVACTSPSTSAPSWVILLLLSLSSPLRSCRGFPSEPLLNPLRAA